MTRLVNISLALALLCVVSSCRKKASESVEAPAGPEEAASARLTLTSPDYAEHYKLQFKESQGTSGTALIDFEDGVGYKIRIDRGNGEPTNVLCEPFWTVRQFGTVDLYDNCGQAVLVVSGFGGTGSDTVVLVMVNPQEGEAVTLSLSRSYQETCPLSVIRTSSNFDDPRFALERRFLHELKHQYGFVDEAAVLRAPDDFEYAAYFWARDNATVSDGRMAMRRLKGRHPERASVNDQLLDGDVVYTAFFKGAVWAHDKANDESFVVFHPDDMYSWPTSLHKTGDWLLVNTRGEGLALVNVRTWYLKRIDKDVNEVQRFEIVGNRAIVNSSIEVALPVDEEQLSLGG